MSAVVDLRGNRAFPEFSTCPDAGEERDYRVTPNGLQDFPGRHWCLLAQIVEAENFIRLRLVAKDKTGHEIVIAFYPPASDPGVDPKRFKVGHTIAILYPYRHEFLDRTKGIRIENSKHAQVIPLPLKNVFALSDKVQEQNSQVDGQYPCQACGTRKTSLMKCAKCGLARYCDQVRLQRWQRNTDRSTHELTSSRGVRQMAGTQRTTRKTARY